ncbi:MAG: hypothetical protein R3C59_06820 [Planctomycetaceae bacterium]
MWASTALIAGTVNVDAGGTITVAATPGTGISAVDGSVELDANGATSDVVVNNTVTTGAGAINLLADDDVTFSADGDVTSTSGKVTVTGDADNDATGSVTLADGSVISAGSGDIEVTANDDITLGRLVTTSNTATAVVVDSEDGAIIDGGDTDGTDIEATDAAAVVTLNAATGIGAAGANGAIDTSVSNLSITNSVRGNVDINETDALSIVGIDQDATAGTVNVDAGGTITVTAGGTGIDAAGGSVELDADGATSDINVDNTISSNGGAVNLLADNDVNFAETGDVSSADGNVTVSANADGVADGTSGQITMADDGSDTATINAGAGTISLSADENIELGRLVTTNSGNFAVTVDSTSGGVIDGGDTDGEDIAASSGGIVINAVTGVGATAGDGADAAIETNAGSLDIDNATSGDIVINETDAVTLFDVQQATAGNITINADGSVAVDNGTAAVAVSTVDSGTIEINANGVGSDLTINSRIQSSTGGMMLTADSDIDFTVNGDVTSTSGNVQITADTAVGNGGGKVTMDNEALINAGSGTIDIDADGDVTLGGLLTTSAANDAVTIDATSGGVVDGGDTFTDIDAANGWVLINAATGVGAVAGAGADPAIETNAATLDIDNSTSGDIVIDETDAVTLFDVQQATAGNITVNAGGTTTIDNAGAGIAVSTVGTGTVEINANGTGSNLVVNDGVSSVAGTIALTADDNVSFDADGDISSSTGNVVVEADADSGGAGSGGVTMTDGAVIDSGTGTIFLESRDTATIGRLVSSSTAVGTAITVISYSGAIADGGDSTGADIEATDSNAQVLLFADGGIGDGDAIETNVADLFFQNSGGTSSGVVNIIETDSITISGQNLDASEPINVCVLAADAVLTVGIGGLLSTNGVITLVADDMQITDTVDAGTADVNLRTKDAAQVIS